MTQELIDAAKTLNAAADALLEVALKPQGPSLANLSDEDKKVLRSLINPWFENEVGERMEKMERAIDALESEDLDEKIEDAVEKLDMSGWEDLDPSDVQEAIESVSKMPDFDAVEEALEVLGPLITLFKKVSGSAKSA